MMLNQPRGGHIFNIDGAGSDGRPTPRYLLLVYSSTFIMLLRIFYLLWRFLCWPEKVLVDSILVK